jgi:hypothetical protein
MLAPKKVKHSQLWLPVTMFTWTAGTSMPFSAR